jgi:hypothetical protein
LTAQWTDILASSINQSAVLNVASWLSRATMDSVGEGSVLTAPLLQASYRNSPTAAFDYQFGALAQTDNALMKAYFGLMYVLHLPK